MPFLLFLGAVLSAIYSAAAQILVLVPTFLFYLASRVTAKTAVMALYVTGTVALYYAFSAAIQSLLNSIAFTAPSIFNILGMFLPSNTATCVYLCLMTRIYALLYVWWRHLYSKYLAVYSGS